MNQNKSPIQSENRGSSGLTPRLSKIQILPIGNFVKVVSEVVEGGTEIFLLLPRPEEELCGFKLTKEIRVKECHLLGNTRGTPTE